MTRSVVRPTLAALLLAACALGADAPPAEAQERGRRGGDGPEFLASPYLELGHWAYPVLDYWISRGRIGSLSPLTTPHRRMDVARAVERLAEGRLEPWEREWVRRLEREFAREIEYLRDGETRPEFRVRGRLGATAWSQTHRDPLRPELEGEFGDAELLERLFLHAAGQAGPIAGAVRTGWERHYHHDPQFPGGNVVPDRNFPIHRPQSLRLEEGYVELQGRYGRLFVGRMYRNWGPPKLRGFLRSDYAYSEEEVGYRLGGEKIFLAGFATAYSDFAGDTTRYVAAHRLEWRPSERLVISGSEGSIHGGPGENLNLRLVSPFAIWELAREGDKQTPSNLLGQFDVWWRPVDGLALWGSALVDATNKVRDEPPGSPFSGANCCEMGGAAGIEASDLARGWIFRARLTALQSLVYRTARPWEEWSVQRVGLGWDKGDLYLGTLEAEWLGRPGLSVALRLDVQARGEESDFAGRLRPPIEEVRAGFPKILVGETERTIRPAVSGRWHGALGGGWSLDAGWDLGVNVIQDYRHAPGDDRTEFVGRIRILLETPPGFLAID